MFNHTIKIPWNNLRKLVDCLDQNKIKFSTDFLIDVDFDGSMYQLDQIIKDTGGVVKVQNMAQANKNNDVINPKATLVPSTGWVVTTQIPPTP